MNNKLVRFTKMLLDFMFYGGIIITILIPLIFKKASDFYPNIAKFYVVMCIMFMASGIFAVLILNELRKILQTVMKQACFVKENVTSLKRAGKYGFVIGFISFIRLMFVITPATFVIIIVFSIAGLFCLVLSQVFEQAVEYKLENDLTV